jgi:hypothetical protein
MRYHAEQAIHNLTPDLRNSVLGIIQQLEQLDDHEGLAELDVAVYLQVIDLDVQSDLRAGITRRPVGKASTSRVG